MRFLIFGKSGQQEKLTILPCKYYIVIENCEALFLCSELEKLQKYFSIWRPCALPMHP